MNLYDIFDMGDYDAYVWSCYALMLAVLVLNVWLARRSLAEQVQQARRRVKMAQSMSDPVPGESPSP